MTAYMTAFADELEKAAFSPMPAADPMGAGAATAASAQGQGAAMMPPPRPMPPGPKVTRLPVNLPPVRIPHPEATPMQQRMQSIGQAARGAAPYAAGAAVGALAGGALALRKMPGVRAQVKAELRARMKGFKNARAHHEAKELKATGGVEPKSHPGAIETARQIVAELQRQGVDPKTARIALSGTGGTGKSSTAYELSKMLGLPRFGLDVVPYKGLKGRTLSKYVQENPDVLKPGTIIEQTHLINKVDPKAFDVVIQLQKPMAQIKKQIVARGRGAGQIDMYDYPKLDRMLSRSFDSLEGTALNPAEGIRMKVAQRGGFSERELNRQLTAMGIKPKHLQKMRRDDKLTSLETGKRSRKGTYGWHYLNKRNIAGGIAAPVVGAAAGAGAVEGGRRLTQPPVQNPR